MSTAYHGNTQSTAPSAGMRAAGKRGQLLSREKAEEGGGRGGIKHFCSAFCDALFGFRNRSVLIGEGVGVPDFGTDR